MTGGASLRNPTAYPQCSSGPTFLGGSLLTGRRKGYAGCTQGLNATNVFRISTQRFSRRMLLNVEARRSGRTRLATRILSVPRRIDLYFSGSLLRRGLWTSIAFFAGFYAGNTVSLSFGALAINDVVAAAVTVGFVEVVSAVAYGADEPSLKYFLMNSFKIGVMSALIVDALKLGG